MSVSLLPYHPQEIRKQVLEVQERLVKPDQEIDKRDLAIGELNSNVLFLSTTISAKGPELSDFQSDFDKNMMALLDALDKMITIFKKANFPYFTDAGWQAAGASVNFKDYLGRVVKDFIETAKAIGRKSLPVQLKGFLEMGVGPLAQLAEQSKITIDNKAEILELLARP